MKKTNSKLDDKLAEIEFLISADQNQRRKSEYQSVIKAAILRRDIEHFTEERNLYEVEIALDFIDNQAKKLSK